MSLINVGNFGSVVEEVSEKCSMLLNLIAKCNARVSYTTYYIYSLYLKARDYQAPFSLNVPHHCIDHSCC